jgi:hypothetical protein
VRADLYLPYREDFFVISSFFAYGKEVWRKKLLSTKIVFKMWTDYLHVLFFRDWHIQRTTMGLDYTEE